MAKYKNISNGPRGFHTVGGLVMVDAGDTIDAELAKHETPNKEWFAKAGAEADDDEEGDGLPSLSGKTKAELLEIAAAEGVEADGDMTNAAIIDAIEAVRAGAAE